MKKLLLFLLTLLLVVSCTKDDNTSNSNTQTFLEKYDGFGFVATSEYGTEYVYFYNGPVFYKYVEIEKYGDGDDETYCTEISEGYLAEVEATINIVTNENNNFLIEFAYDDGDVLSAEFNVVGNTLTISSDDEIITVTKTAVEYSSHNCN